MHCGPVVLCYIARPDAFFYFCAHLHAAINKFYSRGTKSATLLALLSYRNNVLINAVQKFNLKIIRQKMCLI
jgi:hypothetical protein